jgi:CRP/FNR family cyclic AMP-dependent transcriptional regulator
MVTPEMLSQTSLFEGLAEEPLKAIADISDEVKCPHGEVLFWEGDPAELLYILLEGEINIFVQLSSSPGRVTVSVISQPYQTLGWSGLVVPHAYTATALCEADSRLIAIDGEGLMEVLKGDPAVGFAVMGRIAEVMSSRMRNTRLALLKTL